MIRNISIAVLLLALLNRCTTDEKPAAIKPAAAPAATAKKTNAFGPFKFYKSVEVKPGLTYDVVSWGRGSETSGGYLILRSDSARLQYRSTSGALDGKLVDAWNMDMDADGDPEIFLQVEGEGEGSYLTMYVYEFGNSGNPRTIRFPDLSNSTMQQYRGQDSVYIEDGNIMREFPLFKETDNSNKPTGGRKMLQYSMRNNDFSVKEIEQIQKKGDED